jgi:hypothetical protein
MSRWDTIYHDARRTQKAFSHYTGQQYFYKAGKELHIIPVSMAAFNNEKGH